MIVLCVNRQGYYPDFETDYELGIKDPELGVHMNRRKST